MEVLNQLLVKKNKPKTLYLFIHNTTGSELHEIEKPKKHFLPWPACPTKSTENELDVALYRSAKVLKRPKSRKAQPYEIKL